MGDPRITSEILNRRTFAIISHPDAGKTTLTEKLLLYSGMVRTAGMVRGRKNSKATSSDWMAMEQERGISITASAMQFRYKDAVVNVLDTPGHQDFSEDTYRTLTAADCAVMVIDAARGVEEQTKKLFAVCRMQKIPVLTFVNKMDLPSREILDLLQEVEDVLKIRSSPINWPIGYGKNFKGILDLTTRKALLFQKSASGGAERASMSEVALSDLASSSDIEADVIERLTSDLELIEGAGNPFSREEFLAGELTPVFFGSALTNFGVEPFFDAFVDLAPSPRPYIARTGDVEHKVDPIEEPFSGYVFKIQANMNPKHRDSMAFIRLCSGRFERDMTVLHHGSEKQVRLSRSYSMVARDRDTVDEAFAGDIVGVINPGVFGIGDTVSINGGFDFKPMPQFPPEVVAQVRPADVMKRKAFEKGLKQLSDEGAVQILRSYDFPEGAAFVAAVGKLQFDVFQYRLRDEYNVETILDMMPYKYSSYLVGDPKALKRTQGATLALDKQGRVVLLTTSEWERRYILEQNPDHQLKEFLQ